MIPYPGFGRRYHDHQGAGGAHRDDPGQHPFLRERGAAVPRPAGNGYRDYSEEDVKTLEKIHLLRQLHLDIDTIRLVQKGELPLERALFTLLTKLEGDKTALDKAVEVCRELERGWGGVRAPWSQSPGWNS